jgi:hypothetical protein
MKPWQRALIRTALLGSLYLFAAPVYLVIGVVRLDRIVKTFSVIGSGRVICFRCGHENILNRFATCNRCRATEYGSLLYCSFCRQVSHCLPCGECGVTIRVIPKGWW